MLGDLAAWTVQTVWQKRLGPKYNRRRNIICRFHPSCSQYAVLAFEKWGLLKGARLTISRVKRCRPDNTDSCVDYP